MYIDSKPKTENWEMELKTGGLEGKIIEVRSDNKGIFNNGHKEYIFPIYLIINRHYSE